MEQHACIAASVGNLLAIEEQRRDERNTHKEDSEEVEVLREEGAEGEEGEKEGKVVTRYHINMVAEPGYFPPGLASGELGVKCGAAAHYHMEDEDNDGVTLRSVSDKVDTVMGIVQGMVAMMTKIYEGNGVGVKRELLEERLAGRSGGGLGEKAWARRGEGLLGRKTPEADRWTWV